MKSYLLGIIIAAALLCACAAVLSYDAEFVAHMADGTVSPALLRAKGIGSCLSETKVMINGSQVVMHRWQINQYPRMGVTTYLTFIDGRLASNSAQKRQYRTIAHPRSRRRF